MFKLSLKYSVFFALIFFLGVLASCSPINLNVPDLRYSDGDSEPEGRPEYPNFDTILKNTGCADFKSYIWNYIYRIASLKRGNIPPYHTVKEAITRRVRKVMKKENPFAKEEDIKQFAMRFVEIYALVTEFMDSNPEKDITETLVQFEYDIEPSDHVEFVNRLRATFEKLDKHAKTLNQNCEEDFHLSYAKKNRSTPSSFKGGGFSGDSMSEWDIKWFYTMRKNLHPVIYGARKFMAVAYQSCSVLDVDFMPEGYKAKGIYAVSKHPSRRGWRRAVSNLRTLNKTHYYLSRVSFGSSSRQCFNVRKDPLIYDYGGKPFTSFNAIDLFKNSGSGSKALGVDCSGFVAGALAGAGLRLKPGVFIRPVHVKGINSWMFKTAERNKLSCLKRQDISLRNPLQQGDIIASNSHVFIVEFVGEDPFNLQSVRKSSECHSKNIKLSDFEFSIIQSSSHNNGVGINRMHIKEAVAGGLNGPIGRGLRRTASRACYKMFGMETHKKLNEISILRHTINAPACRDREIYLKNQECLKGCEPKNIEI